MIERVDPTISWLVCCNKVDQQGISKTLNSIRNQEYECHEIIFVSNGPRSSEIDEIVSCVVSTADFPVKRLITDAHGLTYSLNLGLNHCDGEFVARLDVGDVAHPSRLRLQVAEFSKHGASIVGVGSQYSTTKDDVSWTSTLPQNSDEIRSALWMTTTLCHPSILLRTKELRKAGGYQGFPYSEDFELWLRLTRDGHDFINLPESLVDYDSTGGAARGNPKAYAGIAAYFLFELITAPSKRSVLGLGTYLAKYCYVRLRTLLFGGRK